MQINSRVSVIKIGQNWKVRPEVYDAFTRFRHIYSYTRVTDALHFLLCVALTVLGFLNAGQLPDVAQCVPNVAGLPALDFEMERRIEKGMRISGESRETIIAAALDAGLAELEREGFLRFEEQAEGRKVG